MGSEEAADGGFEGGAVVKVCIEQDVVLVEGGGQGAEAAAGNAKRVLGVEARAVLGGVGVAVAPSGAMSGAATAFSVRGGLKTQTLQIIFCHSASYA